MDRKENFLTHAWQDQYQIETLPSFLAWTEL